MDVIPAIDLLDGRAVRLLRGKYDQVTTYADDPAGLAAEWRGAAARLHLVDLEGARAGRAVQRALVERVVESFGPGVQVGGGVRSFEAVESYFALGVDRVVLGTAAIRHPELVRRAAEAFPERVVVALDAKDGWVATDGWEQPSERRVLDVVAEIDELPLAAFLYTDIDRDGTEVGPNVEATARLARASRHPVIASGGVGSLDHLMVLGRAPGPISAAIVGRALHEGRFSLAQAIQAAGAPGL
jgi:phosphoribosylformimino-5-aminoimidazole carboxamide ribotide isomerase